MAEPKRARKAAASDPAADALEKVEQETADEAEILRDIADADKDPKARETDA